jgi:putative transposase
MRNRRVDSSLHTASRRIIDLLLSEGIGTLVIGKNPLWKQDVQLGKRTNQQFVHIPHARFIEQLTYKAKLVGIEVLREARELYQQGEFSGQRPASHLSGQPG